MNNRPGTPEMRGVDEYHRLLTLLDERRFDEAQIRGRILLESGELGLVTRAKTHSLICWTFIEGLKRPAPEAVYHGEEAVRLASGLNDRQLQVQAMCYLASAHYQMGAYEASRKVYFDLLSLLEANPSLLPYGQVVARQGLAQIHLVEGNYAEALSLLNAAYAYCQDEDSRFLLADLFRRKALVYLKLDRLDEAAHALAQIDESSMTGGLRSLWWKTHLAYTRARVELARDHWATARQLATNALALARELADLPVMAEVACLLAMLDQIEGRKEAARRARIALTYAIHSGRRDVVDDVRSRLREFLANEL